MTLDIDAGAMDHIRGKGGICSITQEHVDTCFEPLPHTVIEYSAPPSPKRYDVHERDGVVLYVDRSMFFKGSVVRVRLGRFLFLRWLELPTHTLFASSD